MTGPARPATLHDVLARQLMGLRSQCDAVLMTMGLIQQQAQPGEAPSDRSVPATFGGGGSVEDAAETERRIREADPSRQ